MDLTIRKRMVGTIPVLDIAPDDLRNQALPMVVYYHGWQSAKEMNLTQARYIAKNKIRVILPDAQNHGERKQPISSIPSLTFWQSIQANLFEFEFLTHYFKQRDLYNGQLAIGGLSMGAITTYALLTHHPEIQGAVALMGTPNPIAYYQRLYRHARERGHKMPKNYEDLLAWVDRYDLSIQPEKLQNRPLMIWNGYRDWRVPSIAAEQFVKDNPEANITAYFEDAGHLVQVDTQKRAADFFKDLFFNQVNKKAL